MQAAESYFFASRCPYVAQAPLAELRDYAGTLRGVTGGHGTFTVELAQYEPVPQHVHNKLVDARAAHRVMDDEP